MRFLDKLEKKIGLIAVPNIAVLLVTLQALGFLMVTDNPAWVEKLALIPSAVLQGNEWWRLITFLALPMTTGFVWILIALMFIYSIMSTIEQQWGAFRTTLYVLTSIVLTIVVAFALDYVVVDVSDFQSTLFLAAATLFPETEVLLFFFAPVKLKWLAWVSVGFLAMKFFQVSWEGKVLLLAIYSNYLFFFGPILLEAIRLRIRRNKYRGKP